MKQNKLKLKKNKHLNNGCFLLAKNIKINATKSVDNVQPNMYNESTIQERER